MKRGRSIVDEIDHILKYGIASACPTHPSQRAVVIYTDGSHIKGTSKMGFGVYMKWGEKEGERSMPASVAVISKVCGIDFPPDAALSNPTMELAAAIVAIRDIRLHMHRISSVKLYADYNGVAKYASGEWNAKKANPKTPVFAAVAKLWQYEIRDIRSSFPDIPIEVIWIPGHSNIPGNERADQLAKASVYRNTVGSLFKD